MLQGDDTVNLQVNTGNICSMLKMQHLALLCFFLYQSYIHPSITGELECPECDELFMADQKYTKHGFEEHLYSCEI